MRTTALLAVLVLLAVAVTACGPPVSLVSADSRWVGPDGERASDDVIAVLRGPEHCDWDSALLLHVGWPLGADKDGDDSFRQYVRDPRGVFDAADGRRGEYLSDADLPQAANASGWSTQDAELWLAPETADEVVYVVGDDGAVEQWPRIDPPVGCA